jgi:hypothetical protein
MDHNKGAGEGGQKGVMEPSITLQPSLGRVSAVVPCRLAEGRDGLGQFAGGNKRPGEGYALLYGRPENTIAQDRP